MYVFKIMIPCKSFQTRQNTSVLAHFHLGRFLQVLLILPRTFHYNSCKPSLFRAIPLL